MNRWALEEHCRYSNKWTVGLKGVCINTIAPRNDQVTLCLTTDALVIQCLNRELTHTGPLASGALAATMLVLQPKGQRRLKQTPILALDYTREAGYRVSRGFLKLFL
jgi:hypothetical protein